MSEILLEINETPVILTTGIYDLLKEQVRRRKLSRAEEKALEAQLKKAKQVLRKDLPANVVSVDTIVAVRDTDTGMEATYKLVAPQKARRKHGTVSILSPIGIALVGYPEGSAIEWTFNGALRTISIVKVTSLP